MRTWLLVGAWISLALVGCRTDPAITLLERDNRLKDDEIWRLRWQIEDLQAALDAGQCASATAPASPRDSVGPLLGPANGTLPGTKPSRRSAAPADTGPPPPVDNVAPPRVFVPEDGAPGSPKPEGMQPPDTARPAPGVQDPGESGPSSAPLLRGKTDGSLLRRSSGPPPVLADSRKVAQVTLGRSVSGSQTSDGKAGLVVVVEPRDSAGRVLLAPAAVHVAMIDPALPQHSARIAEWEFTPEQSAEMARGGEGHGIPLYLLLPATPPAHKALQLFVRYRTADGRQFQIDRPIQLPLPNDIAVKPTPIAEGPLLDPGAEGPISSRSKEAGALSAGPRSGARWSPNPQLPASPGDPAEADTPRTAARPETPKFQRPVWSPERR
jgi:hypothetical protein